MEFTVSVRGTGKVLDAFATIQEAEWFAHHNVYTPEQVLITRSQIPDITLEDAAKLAAEYGLKVITTIELHLNRDTFNDAESAAHYGRIALRAVK